MPRNGGSPIGVDTLPKLRAERQGGCRCPVSRESAQLEAVSPTRTHPSKRLQDDALSSLLYLAVAAVTGEGADSIWE